ncbi:MAG: bifunctional DNA primase/polymerase, partial [Pseudomonadota bacterium]|nr:bifunctional DNA primase/polymerase [Pseudomonadota bacterium]
MAWQEEARDYLDAGLRLIPLHPIIGNKCGCEKESHNPCAAIGKHPLRHGWQNQALIDDATLGNWSSYYQCSGLGWALDDDHIVIDVDSRSGGLESLNTLQTDLSIDLFSVCNAIVKTGGGGWHFYFKKDPGQTIGWKMPEKYRGIDIKQGGGFVVIAGSMHASGAFYEWHSAAKSDLSNFQAIPQIICEMLAATKRAHVNEMKSQGLGDVTEIADMLDYISNDGEGQDYEMWLRIGMSIHHATAGGSDGLKVFNEWSKQSSKYDAADLERRWHSFGKRASNVATLGSLVYIARQAGWQPAIDTNAMTPEELADLKSQWDTIKAQRVDVPSIMDDADIDLYHPPGLLGQINDYVYACSPFPNQNLSLACALAVLTNAIGRRYYWPGRFASIQPNMLILCEAGSSVGKDSILGAAHRLLCKIGMGPALHGRIKS